jgi:hypothetical protein
MTNNWIKKNEYYLENNGWTICKTGKTLVRYGLYQGSINRGWFDTSAEAIAKWKELTG